MSELTRLSNMQTSKFESYQSLVRSFEQNIGQLHQMTFVDGRILSQVMNFDEISGEFSKIKQLVAKTIAEKESLTLSIKEILSKIGA
jgi:hypothetical protein